jgi:hypothetical protein
MLEPTALRMSRRYFTSNRSLRTELMYTQDVVFHNSTRSKFLKKKAKVDCTTAAAIVKHIQAFSTLSYLMLIIIYAVR